MRVKKKRHNGHTVKKKSRKIETFVVQSVCNNCNRSLGRKALFPSLSGLPIIAQHCASEIQRQSYNQN